MATLDKVESLLLGSFPHHSKVEDLLAELGAPSTTVAVLENGVLSARCYSTLGHDTETLFQACSISKAVNAVAVMLAVQRGLFTLESTLTDVLTQKHLDMITGNSPPSQKPIIENITVRQVLSHTSGLSVPEFPGYPPDSPIPTVDEILAGKLPANTAPLRLISPPGFRFIYSGGGALLLQVILETATKQDYPDLIRELIFAPLGMQRSCYGPLPASEKNFAEAHLSGYARSPAGYHHLPELAAAGLWTTPTDLLKLTQGIQKSLSGDGGILPRELAEEMLTEVQGGMALGWERVNSSKAVFGHSGSNDPGYRCMLAGFAPEKGDTSTADCAIAVMTNAQSGYGTAFRIMQTLSTLKGWPAPVYEGMAPQLVQPASDSGADWKAWAGAWTDSKSRATYEIKENGDKAPVVVYNGAGEIALLPTLDARRGAEGGFVDFQWERMPGMTMHLKDDKGEKSVVLARIGSEPDVLNRK